MSSVIGMGVAGSIPTCVGQPPVPYGAGPGGEVYPHVCGAANERSPKVLLDRGLSPRVWGSPHARRY